MQDLDPNASIVGEDGLEYKDFGALLCGLPLQCSRNDVIRSLHEHPYVREGRWTWEQAVFAQYIFQNRSGDHYAAGSADRRLPQGLDFFSPDRSPEGAGGSGAVQAPADPVHAADQPTV